MKTIINTAIFVMAVSVMCCPSFSNVQAYSMMNTENVFTFPMPHSKPLKIEQETKHEKENDINKKRAMVAALGLYLGVMHASAPSQ